MWNTEIPNTEKAEHDSSDIGAGFVFVKQFALCYPTVVCPVCLFCLSVTLVYCGQTVGWIKMPLGTKVGLGPGHIVLDETQLPHGKRQSSPTIFRPMSIVAKRSPILATAA